MVRTLISVLVTLGILIGLSIFEVRYVQKSFDEFHEILYALRQKTDSRTATHEDGIAVREYWNDKKNSMHVWLPHTSLLEIDLQLDEAVSFLYEKAYTDALPKIDVVIGLSANIPKSYEMAIKNIF
jgi:hypothetical protein